MASMFILLITLMLDPSHRGHSRCLTSTAIPECACTSHTECITHCLRNRWKSCNGLFVDRLIRLQRCTCITHCLRNGWKSCSGLFVDRLIRLQRCTCTTHCLRNGWKSCNGFFRSKADHNAHICYTLSEKQIEGL